jgi:PAS domain-containing protein
MRRAVPLQHRPAADRFGRACSGLCSPPLGTRVIVDANRRVISANGALQRLLSRAEEEVVGRSIDESPPPADQRTIADRWGRCWPAARATASGSSSSDRDVSTGAAYLRLTALAARPRSRRRSSTSHPDRRSPGPRRRRAASQRPPERAIARRDCGATRAQSGDDPQPHSQRPRQARGRRPGVGSRQGDARGADPVTRRLDRRHAPVPLTVRRCRTPPATSS